MPFSKKEIKERTPTLELIASHLGDLSIYFLKLCEAENYNASNDRNDVQVKPIIFPKKNETTENPSSKQRAQARKSALSPIKENEGILLAYQPISYFKYYLKSQLSTFRIE